MDLKLKIETQVEYASALRRMSILMQAVPGSPEMAELEALADVIEVYEAVHFPIGEPTPEGLAQHLLEASISHSDVVVAPERARSLSKLL
jgi:antitoxin component HigA of HigAB toxin-antitoxin module